MSNIIFPKALQPKIGIEGNPLTQPSEASRVSQFDVILGTTVDKPEFTFMDQEVPSDLPLGGQQMAVIHQFAGGARTIDVYGPQPHPIELAGEIRSIPDPADSTNTTIQTAFTRMNILDQLRRDGKLLVFRFQGYTFNVVLVDFKPIVHNVHHVSYNMKLEVLSDAYDPLANAPYKLDPTIASLEDKADFDLLALLAILTDLVNGIAAVAAVVNSMLTQLHRDPAKFLKNLLSIVPTLHPSLAAGLKLADSMAFMSAVMNKTFINAMQVGADIKAGMPASTLDPVDIASVLLPSIKTYYDSQKKLNELVLIGPAPDDPGYGTNVLSIGRISPALQAYAATTGTAALAKAKMSMDSLKKLINLDQYWEVVAINPNLYDLATKYYGNPLMYTAIMEANCLNSPTPVGVFDGVHAPVLKIPKMIEVPANQVATKPVG